MYVLNVAQAGLAHVPKFFSVGSATTPPPKSVHQNQFALPSGF
jgi:hypothetical protein